ncbi:MAG: TonB-dependent receptor [Polyangia bacterium]
MKARAQSSGLPIRPARCARLLSLSLGLGAALGPSGPLGPMSAWAQGGASTGPQASSQTGPQAGAAAATDPGGATAATGTAQPSGPTAATSGPGSAIEPQFDVLLPDPEPQAEPGQRSDDSARDFDTADRVLSAAKQVTTVQEAPSIVTVVRADEIQARGYRTLNHVLENIPGWMGTQGIGNHLSLPLVRGTAQAALLLRDGVSMFEPVLNASAFARAVPLELFKSIEVVTGPGGVLWGANSFLGIVNLISKDGEDINGVETGAGYGDGEGTVQDFRIWALFGKAWRTRSGMKVSLVQHISYETYISPRYTGLLTVTRAAAPSPPGPQIYSLLAETNPERSHILNYNGKLTIGRVTLSYSLPWASMDNSLSFGNNLTSGVYDPVAMTPSGRPQRNVLELYDRLVTLSYKSRHLNDRLGLDAKLYGIQFVRDLDAVIVPGTPRNPRGFTFNAPITSYRVGGSLDGDIALPAHNRLLWGGDVFHEWVPESTVRFAYSDPENDPRLPAAALPIACPLQPGSTLSTPSYQTDCPLPFIFGTSRTVAAGYISDQFRPVPQLTLDAGVRVQGGFGRRGYQHATLGSNAQVLGSASLVWNFYRDMHLKANYANGFRPPVFNNTDSNGAAVQFGGNRNLANEESQAFQGEFNARLLKNIGPIRALQLRVDYAYTELKGLIVIANGSYTNRRADDRLATDPSRRLINSVEASARLYASDHTLSLGYTFLHISTNDRGVLRSQPQHWVQLGWVLSLFSSPRISIDQNGTLIAIGSYDDPNRVRSLTLADGSTTIASFSDITFDRLPPQAVINVGARARFLRNRLWTSLNFYNALNQRYAYPDPFYDLSPTLEVSPTPAPGWSFFFQIGGKPW